MNDNGQECVVSNRYKRMVREFIWKWSNDTRIRVKKRWKIWCFLQSYLVPIKNAEKQLETNTYDVNTLAPGFTQYGAWEDSEVIYDRFNSDIGAEPIVLLGIMKDLRMKILRLLMNFVFCLICILISNLMNMLI